MSSLQSSLQSSVKTSLTRHVEYAASRRAQIARLATPHVKNYRNEVLIGIGSYSFVTTVDHITVNKFMPSHELPWVIELLSQLRLGTHVNILHPKSLQLVRRMSPRAHRLDNYVAIGYPKYTGTLATAPGTTNHSSVMTMALSLVTLIERMHRAGVCHRDIKPDNILTQVRSDGTCRYILCDFSASSVCRMTRTNVCAVLYRAPELFAAASRYGAVAPMGVYDNRIDHFALGMVLYTRATGTIFADDICKFHNVAYTDAVYAEFLTSGSYHARAKQFLQRIDESISTLILKLISPNPDDRGPLWVCKRIGYSTFEMLKYTVDAYGVSYNDIATRTICENITYLAQLTQCYIDNRAFVDTYREISTVLERDDMETFAAVYCLMMCLYTDHELDVTAVVEKLSRPNYTVNAERVIRVLVAIFIAYGPNLWELFDSETPDEEVKRGESSPTYEGFVEFADVDPEGDSSGSAYALAGALVSIAPDSAAASTFVRADVLGTNVSRRNTTPVSIRHIATQPIDKKIEKPDRCC